ncbi:MAG: thymidine phosphorylase, partial [Fimbriiglobus sp.]
GRGAFMKTLPEARVLAESLVAVGTANGLKIEVVLTSMDVPFGRTVGNALEVMEAIDTLKGQGPPEVENLSLLLAAAMVRLGGLAASDDEADAAVQNALTSGAALEKFRDVIRQQGGDPRVIDDYSRLPAAPKTAFVKTRTAGIVNEVNAGAVGFAATILGAGRDRAEDSVDHAVGIIVRAKPGDKVRAGDPVFEIRYRDDWKYAHAIPLLEEGFTVGDASPPPAPMVLETIR